MFRLFALGSIIFIAMLALSACESPLDIEELIPDYQRFEVFRVDYDGNTVEVHSGNAGSSRAIVYVPDRSGKNNGAAFFDGNGSYHISGQRLDALSNNFTIMLWVRPDIDDMVLAERNRGNMLTIPKQTVIFHTHGRNWDDQSVGVGLSVGRNVIHVIEHAHNHQPPVVSWSGTLNGWHHVAVVYQDKTPHLYLNGELVHVGQTSIYEHVRPSAGSDSIYPASGIGRGSQNNSFHGAMDEIRIFSKALAAEEIQMVYRN